MPANSRWDLIRGLKGSTVCITSEFYSNHLRFVLHKVSTFLFLLSTFQEIFNWAPTSVSHFDRFDHIKFIMMNNRYISSSEGSLSYQCQWQQWELYVPLFEINYIPTNFHLLTRYI